MSKTTLTAAVALLMAASLPVYAQTSSSSTSSSASAPSKSVSATQLQPGQIRATQMDGATVYDTQNQKVGDVKDIILDKDGKVATKGTGENGEFTRADTILAGTLVDERGKISGAQNAWEAAADVLRDAATK